MGTRFTKHSIGRCIPEEVKNEIVVRWVNDIDMTLSMLAKHYDASETTILNLLRTRLTREARQAVTDARRSRGKTRCAHAIQTPMVRKDQGGAALSRKKKTSRPLGTSLERLESGYIRQLTHI